MLVPSSADDVLLVEGGRRVRRSLVRHRSVAPDAIRIRRNKFGRIETLPGTLPAKNELKIRSKKGSSHSYETLQNGPFPASFLLIFGLFKHHYNFYHKYVWIMIHLVCSTAIQTQFPLDMSLLPYPLDQGSRPVVVNYHCRPVILLTVVDNRKVVRN